MKGKVVVLLMILVLACISIVLTNIVPVMAQERTVGVNEGDWFRYDYINVNWYTNSTLEPPEGLLNANNTEWAIVTATEISGTLITYQFIVHYKDNTQAVYEGSIDVETGLRSPYPDAKPYQFISANLSENDAIFSSEPEERINETIIREYFGENRETNHLSLVSEVWELGHVYQDCYWDRATGFLVESVYEDFQLWQEGEILCMYNLTASYKIGDTNRWVVPESPNIEILSPENKTYTTDSVSLSFTIDKETSWMSYSLDGQANITITGNITLSGLSDGQHSVTVYANDTAENTGASETIYFSVETPEPFPLPLEWIIITVVAIFIAGITGLILYRKGRRVSAEPPSPPPVQ